MGVVETRHEEWESPGQITSNRKRNGIILKTIVPSRGGGDLAGHFPDVDPCLLALGNSDIEEALLAVEIGFSHVRARGAVLYINLTAFADKPENLPLLEYNLYP